MVDTITIDGSEIDSSGSLSLDVGGNLTIDVDGTTITELGGQSFNAYYQPSTSVYKANGITKSDFGSSTTKFITICYAGGGGTVAYRHFNKL